MATIQEINDRIRELQLDTAARQHTDRVKTVNLVNISLVLAEIRDLLGGLDPGPGLDAINTTLQNGNAQLVNMVTEMQNGNTRLTDIITELQNIVQKLNQIKNKIDD